MEKIAVKVEVNAPIEKVWECYTKPEYIMQWNFASEDWHCPQAQVDLRPGGKFSSRMEAKDGSAGFDFEGEYEQIEINKLIRYRFGDRQCEVHFNQLDGKTEVLVSFDPENVFPEEQQRQGWQAILDNFKKVTENA